MAERYRVFSDGAQPGAAFKGVRRIGPGGWGVLVLAPDGSRTERCGYDPATTVPRMEMTAALKGLELVPQGEAVDVTSDSQLLVKGATEWIAGWIRKGWRTSQGTPVENQDLWRALLAAQAERDVTWTWVRGHTGHAHNEAADRLAALGAAGAEPTGETEGRTGGPPLSTVGEESP